MKDKDPATPYAALVGKALRLRPSLVEAVLALTCEDERAAADCAHHEPSAEELAVIEEIDETGRELVAAHRERLRHQAAARAGLRV